VGAGRVDLGSAPQVTQIGGIAENAGAGVAAVGDVNGDGLPDVAISDGARQEAFVVYGRADAAPVDLAHLDAAGLTIDGTGLPGFAGSAVSAAGDVNGDGLADVAITRPAAGGGSVYWIYGRADGGTVHLADLGAGGREQRLAVGAGASALAGGQDLDGDGVPDLVAADPSATAAGVARAGRVWVLSGRGGVARTLRGAHAGDGLGGVVRVSAGGTIAVTAARARNGSGHLVAAAYVLKGAISGALSPRRTGVATLFGGGATIAGLDVVATSDGRSVVAAGVPAQGTAGAAYVVRLDRATHRTLLSNGRRFTGPSPGAAFGAAVALTPSGDRVAVGAPGATGRSGEARILDVS
jgi:hypothetical protein